MWTHCVITKFNTDVTNMCKQIHMKLINEYVKCTVTVLKVSDVVHHR